MISRIKCFKARNLPDDVDHTLGGSLQAWFMNYLRGLSRVQRRLGQRLIESIADDGKQYLAIQVKGCRGTLYFPRNVPVGALLITLPEQLYSWHWHYYQIPQTRVHPDDTVFDCGSAEGAFAFVNQHLGCRIHAFEPLPAFVDGLKRTFAENPKVEVVSAALAEKPGLAYLHEEGMSSFLTAEKTGKQVAVESIDHYCFERHIPLSYLKADLEGFEMSMLRGAAESIRTYKPRIAITTYHKPEDPVEISRWLKKIHPGYRMLLKGVNRTHGNPVMLHAW
jgi:FkbM family methyltransferase